MRQVTARQLPVYDLHINHLYKMNWIGGRGRVMLYQHLSVILQRCQGQTVLWGCKQGCHRSAIALASAMVSQGRGLSACCSAQ